jgi:hypothetical protein
MKLGITSAVYISTDKHAELVNNSIYSLVQALKELPELDVNWTFVNNHIRSESDIDYIRKNTKPTIIYNDDNALSRAWNKGIEDCISKKCDFILIPNLDIFCHRNCIKDLLKFAQTEEEALLWTATSTQSVDEFKQDEFETNTLEAPEFSFFMIKSDFISRFKPTDPDLSAKGKFDENIKPAYYEDNDMHRRIILSGHKALRTTGARYHHYGSGTIKSDPELERKNVSTFTMNQRYYIKKWGGLPGQETYLTPFNYQNEARED